MKAISLPPTLPALPPAIKGINVNFCKNPRCANFGVPATIVKYRRTQGNALPPLELHTNAALRARIVQRSSACYVKRVYLSKAIRLSQRNWPDLPVTCLRVCKYAAAHLNVQTIPCPWRKKRPTTALARLSRARLATVAGCVEKRLPLAAKR